MKAFLSVPVIIVIAIAIFAIQNSSAPVVEIRFLFWKFETSLILTILGSFLLGLLVVFLFWLVRATQMSISKKRKP